MSNRLKAPISSTDVNNSGSKLPYSFRNNSIRVSKLRKSNMTLPGTPIERKAVRFEPDTPTVFNKSKRLGQSFFDNVSMKSQVMPVNETQLDKISDNLGKLCQELQISDSSDIEQYVSPQANIDTVTVRSIMPIVIAKKPSRTSLHNITKASLTPKSEGKQLFASNLSERLLRPDNRRDEPSPLRRMLMHNLSKVGDLKADEEPVVLDMKEPSMDTGPSVMSIRKTLELDSNLFHDNEPAPDLSL